MTNVQALLERELEQIDARIDELQREQAWVDAMLVQLESRQQQIESDWDTLVGARDRAEAELLEVGCRPNPEVPPPSPPKVEQRQPSPRHGEAEGLEPWDIDESSPVPDWIPPSATWRVAVPVPTGRPTPAIAHPGIPSSGCSQETAPIETRVPSSLSLGRSPRAGRT